MNKLVLLFALLTVSIGISYADTDYSWTENAPERYLPKMTQLIISADSPCNTGGEAFKDFIPRFRKDKAFRDSRIRIDDEMGKMMVQYTNFSLFKAQKKATKCDKSYGTWYNVSANEVFFRYEDVLPCSEAGGGCVMARFNRIDGKWYCTAIMAAG